MKVAWKVAQLNPHLASVRYRALLPALNLKEDGIEVALLASAVPVQTLKSFCCIVFAKSFEEGDARMAYEAHALGIPVILDLCDNIFLEGYGGWSGYLQAVRFQAMSRLASAVVTTGPALAAVLREHVPSQVPVIEIPDQVETAAELARVFGPDSLVNARSMRSAVQRAERAAFLKLLKHRARKAVKHPKIAAKIVTKQALIGCLASAKGRPAALAARLAARLPRNTTFGPLAEKTADLARIAQAPRTNPTPAPARKQEEDGRRQVIWFGNHGASYGDFGLSNLLSIAHHLVAVDRDVPLRLLVVSNNRARFDSLIAGLPIPTEYREWNAERIFQDIAESDLCVLPNSRNPFSICKSANRAVLALSQGVPVVATGTPALEPLRQFVVLDDWQDGIRTYLSNPERAAGDVAAAQLFIEKHYSGPAVAGRWAALICRVVQDSKKASLRLRASRPTRALFFLDLVQDLDLALPLLRAAMAKAGLAPKVWVTSELAAQSPRVLEALGTTGIPVEFIPRKSAAAGRGIDLSEFDAFVTVSESTAGPHRAAHGLTRVANAQGVQTYTLQHGLENIGLSYFDNIHDESIRFASGVILTWGDPAKLPPRVSDETRSRCIAVGCPKPVPQQPRQLPLPQHRGPIVGVFENLHWHRYDADYTQRFLDDLVETVAAFPDVLFVVKPHHAGRWLTERYSGVPPAAPNLVLINPRDPEWEPFTAPEIISGLQGVITTPSTVALDAGRAGCAVAVVGNQLELPLYDPLPILRSAADWKAFVASIETPSELLERASAFVQRSILPGDAVARILGRIVADNRGEELSPDDVIRPLASRPAAQ